MNKKAQFEPARKTIYWMIAGLVITIVILAFAMLLASYKNSLTQIPPQLRAELISLRFLNNPDCFAYQDEASGRTYPRVLDLTKFNNETLNQCYSTEEELGYQDYNFRLFLVSENKELITNNYFHKDDFTLSKRVFLKKETGFVPEELKIYVQETLK